MESEPRTRCMVTGGSGFIGSHLVDGLLGRGLDVRILDRQRPSAFSHVPLWRQCDLNDRRAVEQKFDEFQPQVVFHLAAAISLDGDPLVLGQNVATTRNVAQSLEQLVSDCLLVNVSTQLVMAPHHIPRDDTDFLPYSDYGQSKADAELVVRESTIPWVILRPTNVWGPRHPSFASQIWRYIRYGLYLHPKSVDPVRSYGYVSNVTEQMIAAGLRVSDRAVGHVWYVGDAPIPSSVWVDEFSVALRGRPARRAPDSLLRGLARLGDASRVVHGPSPFNSGRLYRITTDYRVPMDASLAMLGTGSITLQEGVRETVGWLNDLPSGA